MSVGGVGLGRAGCVVLTRCAQPDPAEGGEVQQGSMTAGDMRFVLYWMVQRPWLLTGLVVAVIASVVTLAELVEIPASRFGKQKQHICPAAISRDTLFRMCLPSCVSVLLQRDLNGRTYYEFEFTAANPGYTRHQLAVVVAANSECRTHD
jgi:hypothetical protein